MDQRLVDYLATVGVSEDALAGWDVTEAFRAGQPVGFVISRGTEIHFHIFDLSKRAALSRRNIIAFVKPILDEYSFCTTRVPIAVTDHAFRERLGFKQTWRDSEYTYWSLTELPYERHANAKP